MAISIMVNGAPRAEPQSDGSIALYGENLSPDAPPDDRYNGFLFAPAIALAAALRLLGALQQSSPSRLPQLAVQSVETSVATDRRSGRSWARIDFGIEGAAIPVFLDPPQLADLISQLAALLTEMER